MHALATTGIPLYPDFRGAQPSKRLKSNVLVVNILISLKLRKITSNAFMVGGWQARSNCDVLAQCGPLSHATSDAGNSFVL